MKIEISELSDKNYFLEDKLKHSELNKFLSEKVKVNKRWFFYVYMIITISPLSIISYTITKNLLTEELTIVNCLIHVFWA
jgi:hypothetical protein